MLDDHAGDPGGVDGALDRCPVDGAVAHIGPAVFIGALPVGRDILDMHGDDAARILPDPGDRIVPGNGDPAQIKLQLEVIGGGGDQLQRQVAAIDGIELEGMVVPAEVKAGVLNGLAGLGQILAEAWPSRQPLSGASRA